MLNQEKKAREQKFFLLNLHFIKNKRLIGKDKNGWS